VVVRPAEACGPDHFVGVYDHDRELVPAAADFLLEALARDGAAVVIATAPHRDALDRALAARGCALEALRANGRYRSLDADATLARIMRDGRPDARAFTETIGGVLDDAAPSGPVRLFGEMVGLLWDRGNLSGAVELETLWNELAAGRPFALFCAYTMSSLSISGDLEAVKQMCDRHSHVVALQDSGPDGREPTVVTGREHYDRLFVAAPTVLREVRQFVRAVLREWDDDELGSTAEIVASELATNAVQHAHSPFRISIARSPGVIRIAVRDTSFDPPEHVRDDARHDGGRGVRLVAALSRAWGTRDEADGKTVWAEVARAPTH
jgi:anti-sigma regulatory factor (Ser/Thr protein kinase)